MRRKQISKQDKSRVRQRNQTPTKPPVQHRQALAEVTNRQHHESELADDILRGAKSIGDFIGLNERDTFDKLAKGYVPATKEGAIWVSTKSRLRRHYGETQYVPPSDEDETPAPSALAEADYACGGGGR